MTPDLYQLVDLTVPEADGIKGFVEVDDEGRHRLPLVEADGSCEKCRDTAELVDRGDGVDVEHRTVYRMAGTTHTVHLCRDHLAEEPTHVGFTPTGEVAAE